MPVVFPLCSCCNRLRWRTNVTHQSCLTLFYSAIDAFDPLRVAVDNTATDFGAALTGAVVAEDTLTLANDTLFVGDPMFGSKLFIRTCYKELSEIILGGAWKNMVVTGTPGIG